MGEELMKNVLLVFVILISINAVFRAIAQSRVIRLSEKYRRECKSWENRVIRTFAIIKRSAASSDDQRPLPRKDNLNWSLSRHYRSLQFKLRS